MPDLTFLITAGVILIIIGFLLVILETLRSFQEPGEDVSYTPYQETEEKKVKGGGVILIGPIPIVFGSDKRFALIAMILAVVLMLLAIIFMRL